jgi:hypothetical protein
MDEPEATPSEGGSENPRTIVITVEVSLEDTEQALNGLEKLKVSVEACIEIVKDRGGYGSKNALSAVEAVLRVTEQLLRKR